MAAASCRLESGPAAAAAVAAPAFGQATAAEASSKRAVAAASGMRSTVEGVCPLCSALPRRLCGERRDPRCSRRRRGVAAAAAHGPRSGPGDDLGGDPKVQQALVEMLQIQLGKARMSIFVDERSQRLRDIADQAHLEYDRIATRAMKGMDAASSRVLRQLDADAHAIERDLQIAYSESQAQQRDAEEFEQRMKSSRNEGLFFKTLYSPPRSGRPIYYRPSTSSAAAAAALEQELVKQKLKLATDAGASGLAPRSEDFSAMYRQLLYAGLSMVIVSLGWSSSSALLHGVMMRGSKMAAYGLVLSCLSLQLAFASSAGGSSSSNVGASETLLPALEQPPPSTSKKD
eukprot:SM000019S05042  [mRNA]  locus=s19:618168:619705:- [translate_table: standard]